jgi:putative oxidoreductase
MKSLFPSRFAEIIFGFVTGTFGVLHFMNADMMSAIVPDYMPGDGTTWIYITGVVLIGVALAIIVNKFKKPACYLLALMLLVFVFMLHLKPAMDGNPGALLKDLALAMSAVIIGNGTARRY